MEFQRFGCGSVGFMTGPQGVPLCRFFLVKNRYPVMLTGFETSEPKSPGPETL